MCAVGRKTWKFKRRGVLCTVVREYRSNFLSMAKEGCL